VTDDEATRLRGTTHVRGTDATLLRSASSPPPGSARTRSPGPGTVLKDRFVLQREIGRGGMGTVHAAMDRRKVEAQDPAPMVAIKVLQPELAGHPVAFVALQRESRRAQELAHPNIATVFDFDRDGDTVFVTMELLNGQPLDEAIRGTDGFGMSRQKALPVIRGIAQGLAYAHRKGLVHSDLKPSNVYLTEEGQPKILDFGIARVIPGGARISNDRFDAGAIRAYTEAYATSEMVTGADPSPADDIYALGLVAYELLTGRHPYQRYSAQDAWQRGLKLQPIDGLSRREWSVIERSLSFERTTRPKDADDFIRSLEGPGRLQGMMIALAVVLTMIAGYLGYAKYQASGPDVPFSQLPAAVQTEFREHVRLAEQDWQLYLAAGGHSGDWQGALQSYAEAYRLHPRNRTVTRAMRELADRVLTEHAVEAHDHATFMAEVSPSFLANHESVRKQLAEPAR
jgi:hypothetical protein